MTFARILQVAGLLAILFTMPALAQEVQTPIMGVYVRTVSPGLNSLGITLLNPDLVRSACTGNTSTNLTVAAPSSVGALLTPGEPYYVEVLDGPLEGERFDVDTAATISAGSTAVVLRNPGPHSTSQPGGSQLTGSRVALRKHFTLEQLNTLFTPPLIGSNTPSTADQVLLFDLPTQAFRIYYLRADRVTWRIGGSSNPENKTVLPPGSGFIIRKLAPAAELVVTGAVRENAFAWPQRANLSFAAPAYPVSFSPAGLGGTATNGWVGNNTASSADQLWVLNPSTRNFDAYYLRGNGVDWRRIGLSTNFTTNALFNHDSGFMTKRQSAGAGYVLGRPF